MHECTWCVWFSPDSAVPHRCSSPFDLQLLLSTNTRLRTKGGDAHQGERQYNPDLSSTNQSSTSVCSTQIRCCPFTKLYSVGTGLVSLAGSTLIYLFSTFTHRSLTEGWRDCVPSGRTAPHKDFLSHNRASDPAEFSFHKLIKIFCKRAEKQWEKHPYLWGRLYGFHKPPTHMCYIGGGRDV